MKPSWQDNSIGWMRQRDYRSFWMRSLSGRQPLELSWTGRLLIANACSTL